MQVRTGPQPCESVARARLCPRRIAPRRDTWHTGLRFLEVVRVLRIVYALERHAAEQHDKEGQYGEDVHARAPFADLVQLADCRSSRSSMVAAPPQPVACSCDPPLYQLPVRLRLARSVPRSSILRYTVPRCSLARCANAGPHFITTLCSMAAGAVSSGSQ